VLDAVGREPLVGLAGELDEGLLRGALEPREPELLDRPVGLADVVPQDVVDAEGRGLLGDVDQL
jgi:hypothetical protein